MKNLKRLFALFLLAFCTLFVSAQTEVTVVENNSMNTTLVVTEQGKIYFSTENMYVDAGDGSISTFAVADIRKMTFNGVTGVRNYTEQSNVLLYPNPATSFWCIW